MSEDVWSSTRVSRSFLESLPSEEECGERFPHPGHVYAYSRTLKNMDLTVSERNTFLPVEVQHANIQQWCNRVGLSVCAWFDDRTTRKSSHHPHFTQLDRQLVAGDIVVTNHYSCLFANDHQVEHRLQEWHDRGISIIWLYSGTLTPYNPMHVPFLYLTDQYPVTKRSYITSMLVALFKDVESTSVYRRRQDGIHAAREAHKYQGKKPYVIRNFPDVYVRWKLGTSSLTELAHELGMSSRTIRRRFTAYESTFRHQSRDSSVTVFYE